MQKTHFLNNLLFRKLSPKHSSVRRAATDIHQLQHSVTSPDNPGGNFDHLQCRRLKLLHSVQPENPGRIRPRHSKQVARGLGSLLRSAGLRGDYFEICSHLGIDHTIFASRNQKVCKKARQNYCQGERPIAYKAYAYNFTSTEKHHHVPNIRMGKKGGKIGPCEQISPKKIKGAIPTVPKINSSKRRWIFICALYFG